MPWSRAIGVGSAIAALCCAAVQAQVAPEWTMPEPLKVVDPRECAVADELGSKASRTPVEWLKQERACVAAMEEALRANDAYSRLDRVVSTPRWNEIAATSLGIEMLADLSELAEDLAPQDLPRHYARFQSALKGARETGEPIGLREQDVYAGLAYQVGDASTAVREFADLLEEPSLRIEEKVHLKMSLFDAQIQAGSVDHARSTLSSVDLGLNYPTAVRVDIELQVADRLVTLGDTDEAGSMLESATLRIFGDRTKDEPSMNERDADDLLARSRKLRVRLAQSVNDGIGAASALQHLLFATQAERPLSPGKKDRLVYLIWNAEIAATHRDFESTRRWAYSILVDSRSLSVGDLSQLAEIYFRAGLYAEVETDFGAFLVDNPAELQSLRDCAIRDIIGRARAARGERSEAARMWSVCAGQEGQPRFDYVSAALNAAEVELISRNFQASRQWCLRARKLLAGFPNKQLWDWLDASLATDLIEIRILGAEGKKQEAIVELGRSMKAHAKQLDEPDDAALRNRFAQVALEIGSWTDAKTLLDANHRLFEPGQISLYDGLDTLTDLALLGFRTADRDGTRRYLDDLGHLMARGGRLDAHYGHVLSALNAWLEGKTPEAVTALDQLLYSRPVAARTKRLARDVAREIGAIQLVRDEYPFTASRPSISTCITYACAVIAHVARTCALDAGRASFMPVVGDSFRSRKVPQQGPVRGLAARDAQIERDPGQRERELAEKIFEVASCNSRGRESLAALLSTYSDLYESEPAAGWTTAINEQILAISAGGGAEFAGYREKAAVAVFDALDKLPNYVLRDPLAARAARLIAADSRHDTASINALLRMIDDGRLTPPPTEVTESLAVVSGSIAAGKSLNEVVSALSAVSGKLSQPPRAAASLASLQRAESTLATALANRDDLATIELSELSDVSIRAWRRVTQVAPGAFERLATAFLQRTLALDDRNTSLVAVESAQETSRDVLSAAMSVLSEEKLLRVLHSSEAAARAPLSPTRDAGRLTEQIAKAYLVANEPQSAVAIASRWSAELGSRSRNFEDVLQALALYSVAYPESAASLRPAVERLQSGRGVGPDSRRELTLLISGASACSSVDSAAIARVRDVAEDILRQSKKPAFDADDDPMRRISLLAAIRILKRAGALDVALDFAERAVAKQSRSGVDSVLPGVDPTWIVVLDELQAERIMLLVERRRFEAAYDLLMAVDATRPLFTNHAPFMDPSLNYSYLALWFMDSGGIETADKLFRRAREATAAAAKSGRVVNSFLSEMTRPTFDEQQAYREYLLAIVQARLLLSRNLPAEALQRALDGFEPSTTPALNSTLHSRAQLEKTVRDVLGNADAMYALVSPWTYRRELVLSLIARQSPERRHAMREMAFGLAQQLALTYTGRTYATLARAAELGADDPERANLRFKSALASQPVNSSGMDFNLDHGEMGLLGIDFCSNPQVADFELRELLGNRLEVSSQIPDSAALVMSETNPRVAKQERPELEFSATPKLTVPLMKLAAAQSALGTGQSLMMFVPLRNGIVVLGTTSAESSFFLDWVDMPERQLTAQVELIRNSVSGADPASLSRRRFPLEASFELYSKLVRPFADTLPEGARELVYVTMSPLDSVPLSLLARHLPATTAGQDAELYRATEWLGDRFLLRMLPSITERALSSGSRPAATYTSNYIGFGSPSLTPVEECRTARADGARRSVSELCALPRTEDLLVSLGSAFGAADAKSLACISDSASASSGKSSCHVRDQFSEQLLRDETLQARLAGTRVIAFATHGLTAEQAGWFGWGGEPALVTTPGDGTARNNGLLGASEIGALNLTAELVILSACNSAASNGNPNSEALSGIAQGFFLAGAKSLLVSSWTIDEDATVELFSRLADKLRTGVPLPRALQESMRSILNDDGGRLPPQFAHPVYWAPFTLVGAP